MAQPSSTAGHVCLKFGVVVVCLVFLLLLLVSFGCPLCFGQRHCENPRKIRKPQKKNIFYPHGPAVIDSRPFVSEVLYVFEFLGFPILVAGQLRLPFVVWETALQKPSGSLKPQQSKIVDPHGPAVIDNRPCVSEVLNVFRVF